MNLTFEKKILALIIISIVILSAFAALLQYEVNAIKESDEKPLIVIITSDKISGYSPFGVNFTSNVINQEGGLLYTWDFGDGSKSNETTPSHIYEGNGSYICTLNVTDGKGRKSNDSIELTLLHNRAPRVSIILSDSNPMRQFIPSLVYLTKTFGGRKLYNLRKLNLTIPSWKKDSDFHVSALVDDPEGDEIVSYSWELRAPIVTTMSGSQIKPVYTYSGKDVTFPIMDIYVSGKYTIVVTVKDSEGNTDIESVPFEVQTSNIESQYNYIVKTLIIQKLLNTIYQDYFPDYLKYEISDPLWFGGPIGLWPGLEAIDENITNLMERLLPSGLNNLSQKLWGGLLGMIDQKFPKRPTPPSKANLIFSDISEINFSTNVNESGGVPTEISVSRSFTIINNDDSKTSKNTYVMLYDPTDKDKEGLDNNIEEKELQVTIKSGSLSKKLFNDGEYKDGFHIGDITYDHQFDMDITVTLKESGEGTFEKGTYNCTLYIYQKDAGYVGPVPFTIIL